MEDFYASLYDIWPLDTAVGHFVLDNLHWLMITGIVHLTVLGAVAYFILLERKVASWAQDRIGPNRVGFSFGLDFMPKFHFWGLGQPLADGIKFVMKEDYASKNVDRVLFTLAPMMMVIVVIISIAAVPWGGVKGEAGIVDVTNVIAAGGDGVAVAEAIYASPVTRRGNEIIGDIELFAVNPREARTDPEGAIAGATIGDPVSLSYVGQLRPGESLDTLPANATVLARFVQGWYFQIAHIDIGVLFVLAALSLAVYGVVVGGWASNNKYSFLGGLRATANMISYEIPLGLSVLVVVILFSTLDLTRIVDLQASHYWLGFIPAWNIFVMPLAFLLFIVCIHAEANRAPFDLAEAEQELVGGYHTEYSSMRFAIFFLAEYAGMITTSAVCVALFFGGWHLPWIDLIFPNVFGGGIVPGSHQVVDSFLVCVFRFGVFFAKTAFFMFVFMWTRWSLPRFRFDQIMQIAWRGMIPIGLVMVVATTIVVYATGGQTANGLTGEAALWLLASNVLTLAAIVVGSKLLPKAPNVNEKQRIPGSRFNHTPVPKPLATA